MKRINISLSLTIITIVIGLQFYTSPAVASDVGGIVINDTTWTLTGSPYQISVPIQIAEGSTLSIEPGTIVNEGSIEVYGTLEAIGTPQNHIVFNDVDIVPRGNVGELFSINLQYAEINSGSLYYPTGYGIYGGLILKDSIIKDIPYMEIWYPETDCYIERNVFMNSGGISVGQDGVSVFIKNNVFFEQTTGYAVENWASYSGQTIVENNSFLSTDRIALLLPDGYSSTGMIAINNYWNTSDVNIIDSMVYDKNDNLGCADYIEYSPFLSTPHNNTPTLTTNAGNDQSDCLFNWAEDNYPELFSPSRPTSQSVNPYYFRYYSEVNTYLGYSSANDHLYFFSANGDLSDLGLAATWSTQAGCR